MKRQIKFRAWDIILKVMFNNNEIKITCDGISLRDGIDGDYVLLKKEKPKLMQYTGLKDKNGVEIYEHDILKGVDAGSKEIYTDMVVEFEDGCFAIIGGYELCNSEIKHTQMEVIGNIYENKDLL